MLRQDRVIGRGSRRQRSRLTARRRVARRDLPVQDADSGTDRLPRGQGRTERSSGAAPQPAARGRRAAHHPRRWPAPDRRGARARAPARREGRSARALSGSHTSALRRGSRSTTPATRVRGAGSLPPREQARSAGVAASEGGRLRSGRSGASSCRTFDETRRAAGVVQTRAALRTAAGEAAGAMKSLSPTLPPSPRGCAPARPGTPASTRPRGPRGRRVR